MYSGLDPELDMLPAVYESDNTADMLKYVREIGALGGTLTLIYEDDTLALSGDSLLFAADDYDADPFTIAPAELQEPIEPAPRVYPSTLGKVTAVSVPLGIFVLIGLSLL